MIAVIIGVFILMSCQQESFATNADRDAAHKDYFKNTSSPSFEEYRNVVSDGNILDYTKYKKIYNK